MISIPATSTWAIALYMAKVASNTGSPIAITFWQMIGTGFLGILLLIFVKNYREGFLFRVRNQGRVFLGFSFINESLSEGSFLFGNLAVAIAPTAAFVSAMSGVQSVFVLLLFFLFPQGKRSRVTLMQWLAVALIAVGVFLINS